MPSSPCRGVDHRPRASLLTQAALLATLVALSDCLSGPRLCPRSLDCAREGRHFCQKGSSRCGPCLHPLVETSHGRCVVKRRHASHVGKETNLPELDEEIDFLSTIISEQKLESGTSEAKHSAPLSQDVPEATDEVPAPRRPTHHPTTRSPSTAPPANATNATSLPVTSSAPAVRSGGPEVIPYTSNDHAFLIMTSVFVVAGSVALLLAGFCWIRLQRGVRLAQKVDYQAYGGKGPHAYDNNVPGDKKLAHSAQMYHYQHQKQQMLSLEKHREEPTVPDSGATSDEENEDGDFTVYECPGLAPTGEMEVKNPLFDDSTLYLQRSHK